MPQRIRELLDDAVADLEPRNHDPVGEVIGRNRAARRRTMLAGALAAILVAGGLVAANVALGGRPDAPVVAVPETPVVPRVVDGVVVAGALRLPVPAGWKVKIAGAAGACNERDRTVLLQVTPVTTGCQIAAIEVFGSWLTDYPAGSAVSSDPLVVTGPVPITLRGGEPAWMTEDLDSADMNALHPVGASYWNNIRLPWSRVSIVLRNDAATERQIIKSMWSEPAKAGVLALPETVAFADLTVPDDQGRYSVTGYGQSTNPATIRAVLALLRKQRQTVTDADACAGPAQHGARLLLRPVKPVPFGQIAPSRGPGHSRPAAVATAVVIAVGDKCQEAVSDLGGRVRLTDDALDQLKRLLGIEAR